MARQLLDHHPAHAAPGDDHGHGPRSPTRRSRWDTGCLVRFSPVGSGDPHAQPGGDGNTDARRDRGGQKSFAIHGHSHGSGPTVDGSGPAGPAAWRSRGWRGVCCAGWRTGSLGSRDRSLDRGCRDHPPSARAVRAWMAVARLCGMRKLCRAAFFFRTARWCGMQPVWHTLCPATADHRSARAPGPGRPLLASGPGRIDPG